MRWFIVFLALFLVACSQSGVQINEKLSSFSGLYELPAHDDTWDKIFSPGENEAGIVRTTSAGPIFTDDFAQQAYQFDSIENAKKWIDTWHSDKTLVDNCFVYTRAVSATSFGAYTCRRNNIIIETHYYSDTLDIVPEEVKQEMLNFDKKLAQQVQ